MIEEEDEDIDGEGEGELEVEMLTGENILLYSTVPGPRIFTLMGGTESLLGLLLEEADDSFLVGMPARMVAPLDKDGNLVMNGPKTILPYVPLPYFRLMKSTVMYMMYMFGEFEDKYMEYIEKKSAEIYPELGEYYDPELGSPLTEQDTVEVTVSEEAVGLDQDAAEGNQVQGMSDEELKDYLTEKYNNGELPGGSRKKQ